MRLSFKLALIALAGLGPAGAAEVPQPAPAAAGTPDRHPSDITPDEVHAALKRQIQCLDGCQGTRVAVTAFGGVTFGAWRRAGPDDGALPGGTADGWLVPATVAFQVRHYYNDQTLVEDWVWDARIYRGEGGLVTVYNAGQGTTSTVTETRQAAQLPPSP